ncbi:MAG: HEAT repeat domain-containing protein [Gemmatimonadota bacterium]|nr:HEAT repeat domain-containing protein [Gemmatimonadota bacterium]
MSAARFVVLCSATCVSVAWSALGAQSLQARVNSAGDGQVNFHFTGRPGICGDGMRFMRIGTSYQGSYSSDMRSEPCVTGPVQVRLTVDAGAVSRVETWVGTLRVRGGRDLGETPAPESAEYLLALASHGPSSASKAILPAVLAESTVVWPTLLNIARDSATSRSTRQEASFWLSRFAAGALAGRKNDPLNENDRDDGDIGLKKHAVFVLSQLPHDEGVPALINVARSNVDQRVRGQALFWLGQTGDARALAVFESILRT